MGENFKKIVYSHVNRVDCPIFKNLTVIETVSDKHWRAIREHVQQRQWQWQWIYSSISDIFSHHLHFVCVSVILIEFYLITRSCVPTFAFPSLDWRIINGIWLCKIQFRYFHWTLRCERCHNTWEILQLISTRFHWCQWWIHHFSSRCQFIIFI